MKNHWLDKKDPHPAMKAFMETPFDYSDPTLDFFSAKDKIVQYLIAKHKLSDEFDILGSNLFHDMVDQWALTIDLLALARQACQTLSTMVHEMEHKKEQDREAFYKRLTTENFNV